MSLKITNQKPARLEPRYVDAVTKDLDVHDIVRQTVVSQLSVPLMPGQPASFSMNGNPLSEDDLVSLVMTACGEVFDAQADSVMKELLGQCLVNYNGKSVIGANESFVIQSGAAAGLAEPSPTVAYMPGIDVIPTARAFLAGTGTYDQFFASLAWFARPETLGFYFCNSLAFDNFIQWFGQQMANYSQVLAPDVNRLCSDFLQLKLDGLTESLVLRNTDGDGNEPLSFPRLVAGMLMQYKNTAGPGEFGVLPFNIAELCHPKTLVFVNVEAHAKASPKQITDEWNLVNNCLQQSNRPKMISNRQLTRLTATQRHLQSIAAQAANAVTNLNAQASRAAGLIKFSKNRPHTVDVARAIKKILSKMACTNKSMNVYKSVKSSFAKPNRRDPDDYNKQGKAVSTKYKPDIHLYIDTSGSISEEDYESSVKACIALARSLGVNMYFNSFSHIMSQTTRLHLAGKSTRAVYEEFRRVPKVSGGTDYEQIWNFINISKKRTRELSLIISDFEWTARTAFIKHPKNLYYLPCSVLDWKSITGSAQRFCQSAMHNDPNIRQHILF